MRASGDVGAFGPSSRADEAGSASRLAVSSAHASSGEEGVGLGSARGGVSDAAARRAAKKEVARIERRLERLRAEASSLESRLESLSMKVATDASVVSELTTVSVKHQGILGEIEGLEEAWLEAAEAAE